MVTLFTVVSHWHLLEPSLVDCQASLGLTLPTFLSWLCQCECFYRLELTAPVARGSEGSKNAFRCSVSEETRAKNIFNTAGRILSIIVRKWTHQPEKLSNANYFDIEYTAMLNNTLRSTKSKKRAQFYHTLISLFLQLTSYLLLNSTTLGSY